jgi:hypothetical protein
MPPSDQVGPRSLLKFADAVWVVILAEVGLEALVCWEASRREG